MENKSCSHKEFCTCRQLKDGLTHFKPKPDPIREVYKKWKEYEKIQIHNYDLAERMMTEMWSAIKKHCEEG